MSTVPEWGEPYRFKADDRLLMVAQRPPKGYISAYAGLGVTMGLRDRMRDLGKMVLPQSGVGGKYEFEPRTDRMSRRLKGVQGPGEDREGILRFVESRQGVEAYVEPKTVMHPLSVVLVAKDGEHRRFELFDDAYLRELMRTHDLKVFDAVRAGYPQRMRDYLRPQRTEGREGGRPED